MADQALTPPTTAQRWLVRIGSLGPLGHLPASGTSTVAIAGIPLFWLLSSVAVPLQVLLATGFSAAAIWIHHHGDKALNDSDSSLLVWDELAGFFVAVVAVPFTWQLATLAFFAERLIDIAKVPPAKQIEDHWPGGWGVVGDDIIAGLYTCGLLHLAIYLAPGWCGLSA
jgi:phosphatidylglycerophosphatase A